MRVRYLFLALTLGYFCNAVPAQANIALDHLEEFSKHLAGSQETLRAVTKLLTTGEYQQKVGIVKGVAVVELGLRAIPADREEKTRIVAVIAKLAEIGLKGKNSENQFITEQLNAGQQYFDPNGAAAANGLSTEQLQEGQIHTYLVFLAYEYMKAVTVAAESDAKASSANLKDRGIAAIKKYYQKDAEKIGAYFADLETRPNAPLALKRLLGQPTRGPNFGPLPTKGIGTLTGGNDLLAAIKERGENPSTGLKKAPRPESKPLQLTDEDGNPITQLPKKGGQQTDIMTTIANNLNIRRVATTGLAGGAKTAPTTVQTLEDSVNALKELIAASAALAEATDDGYDVEDETKRVTKAQGTVDTIPETLRQQAEKQMQAEAAEAARQKAETEAKQKADAAERRKAEIEARQKADETKRLAEAEAAKKRKADLERTQQSQITAEQRRAEIEAEVRAEAAQQNLNLTESAIGTEVTKRIRLEELAALKKK